MDFDDRRQEFEHHHYAFIASDDELDAVMQRVKDAGIPFGSSPEDAGRRPRSTTSTAGRGYYFRDPNGHLLEVITHTYV